MADLRLKDKSEIGRALSDDDLIFVTKTVEDTDNNSTFSRVKNQITNFVTGLTESIYAKLSHLHTISNITNLTEELNTKASLSAATFTEQLNASTFSATTLSASTIISAGTNISSLFIKTGGDSVSGDYYITGGVDAMSFNADYIRISGTDLDNLFVNVTGDTVSGQLNVSALSATTLSANTIISAGTNISSLFIKTGGDSISGDYYITGGVDAMSFNGDYLRLGGVDIANLFVNVTGDTITTLSATTLSANTIISAGTNIENIFIKNGGGNVSGDYYITGGVDAMSFNADYIRISGTDLDNLFVNVTGDTVSGQLNVSALSATTLSASTIISAGTNISSLFIKTGGDSVSGDYYITGAVDAMSFNADYIRISGTDLDNLFVNVTGDTVNGQLNVSVLSATTLSANTINGEVKWDVCYLTYSGTSGTTSGTHGCTLTSPGNWTVTNYSTTYYCDDAGGNLNIIIPDASAINEGKTFVFVKPRIVSSSNYISITTPSKQFVNTYTAQTLYSSNDRIEMVSVPFSSNGSLTYKYRTTNSTIQINEVIEVSQLGSQLFTTIKSAVDFCNSYANSAKRIKVNPGNYPITQTVEINCAYPITIEGFGTETTLLYATSALSGTPMFDIKTNCDFSNLSLSGTTGYGLVDDECCLDCSTSGLYFEIHQLVIDGFFKGVELEGNSEVWVFDSIIKNCVNGLWCVGAKMGASELTLTNNTNGVYLSASTTADTFSIQNTIFNVLSGETGIQYKDNIIKPTYHFATGNAFYGQGTYISGLTFNTSAQSDIRYENNAGLSDYKPLYSMWITGSTSAVTCTNQNQYYKATFTEANIAGSEYIKFSGNTVNKVTYLPQISRRVRMFLSGDLSCGTNTKTISISIFKNGNIKLQDIDVICAANGQPYPFSLVGETTVNPNDYFEVFVANLTDGGRAVTVRTMMFLITT